MSPPFVDEGLKLSSVLRVVLVGVQGQIRREVKPPGQAGPLPWSTLLGGVRCLLEFDLKVKSTQLWERMTQMCLLGSKLGVVFNKELVK